jgi:uncharacterized protein (UPF0335 family)
MRIEMTENWHDEKSAPSALKLRQVRGFIDHLNRLEMEAKQLATQVHIVRNYAKDLAWGLAQLEEGVEDDQ